MQIAEKNLSRLLEVCNRLRPFQVQDATIDGFSDCRGSHCQDSGGYCMLQGQSDSLLNPSKSGRRAILVDSCDLLYDLKTFQFSRSHVEPTSLTSRQCLSI